MTTYRAGGPGFVPTACTANNLNQYTSISNSAPSATPCEAFVPQFDLDGNQTLVKTSTGVWQVAYKGENRPVSWTCGTTNTVMSFDRMGRRTEYNETVDGVTNSHVSLVYDGLPTRKVYLAGALLPQEETIAELRKVLAGKKFRGMFVVASCYPTINEPHPCVVCIGARSVLLCRRCAEMCRGNGLQFGENPGAGGFEFLFSDEVPGEETVEAVQAGGDAATLEGRGKR